MTEDPLRGLRAPILIVMIFADILVIMKSPVFPSFGKPDFQIGGLLVLPRKKDGGSLSGVTLS